MPCYEQKIKQFLYICDEFLKIVVICRDCTKCLALVAELSLLESAGFGNVEVYDVKAPHCQWQTYNTTNQPYLISPNKPIICKCTILIFDLSW
ncbi:Uncharacterised protein [Moraxella cuniculi]|uniref:Uncharacterized protein n=1 Tax=Moraxella cuniculi TaxID=34061 RepID=A0A448GYA1_9GAMM|nr:Uncharacterised protein [Moraxella cuniculi]